MPPAHAAAANPAAGWFADPHAPNLLRWWDGFQWTHHVHPAAPVATPTPTPSAVTNGFVATPSAATNGFVATPSAATNGFVAMPSTVTNGFVATPSATTQATAATPLAAHHAYSPQYATSSAPAATQHGGQMLGSSAAESSLTEANPKSLAAIGFSLAYLVMAITTGIVLAGIVPAIYTVQAFANREKLAPGALLAAGAAIAFAFTHMQA